MPVESFCPMLHRTLCCTYHSSLLLFLLDLDMTIGAASGGTRERRRRAGQMLTAMEGRAQVLGSSGPVCVASGRGDSARGRVCRRRRFRGVLPPRLLRFPVTPLPVLFFDPGHGRPRHPVVVSLTPHARRQCSHRTRYLPFLHPPAWVAVLIIAARLRIVRRCVRLYLALPSRIIHR